MASIDASGTAAVAGSGLGATVITATLNSLSGRTTPPAVSYQIDTRHSGTVTWNANLRTPTAPAWHVDLGSSPTFGTWTGSGGISSCPPGIDCTRPTGGGVVPVTPGAGSGRVRGNTGHRNTRDAVSAPPGVSPLSSFSAGLGGAPPLCQVDDIVRGLRPGRRVRGAGNAHAAAEALVTESDCLSLLGEAQLVGAGQHYQILEQPVERPARRPVVGTCPTQPHPTRVRIPDCDVRNPIF